METTKRDPLLNAKFVIPRLPARHIPRPGLIEELKRSSLDTLTLLIAPAGYGKTTLLIHWANETSLPVAWLTLDNEDNDPIRFFSCLFKSLERIHAEWTNELDALLASYHAVFTRSFIRSIIGIIAQHEKRFALIIEDYHLIRSSDIHAAISYFLENLPDNMHLAISTRGEPDLPLAKLRVKDVVQEIRIDQLRFSLEEVDRYFHSLGLPRLSQHDLGIIEAKTEGWAAGLQLVAQLLLSGDATASLKNIDLGQSRYIMDYLVQEVLALQHEPIQNFLLRTSILNRLNASICEAITGTQDSSHIISQLETNGVFIIPLDHERQWYRYHPLFQDILQSALRERFAEEEKLLHHRASEWLAQEGYYKEAISHALKAEDFTRAADIAALVGQEMMNQGRFHTMCSLLRHLPDELIISRPNLCRGRAWAQSMVGDMSDIDRWIDYGMRDLVHTDDSYEGAPMSVICNILNIQSMAAQVRGDYGGALQLAQEAHIQLPDQNPLLSAITHANTGDAYYFLGMLEPSKHEYQLAARHAKEFGQLFVYMKASYYLSRIYFLQGQPRLATITIDEANAQLGDRQDYPPQAGYYLIHGDLLYEQNTLGEAEDFYQEGLRLARLSGDYYYLLCSFMGLGRVCLAKQEFEQAEEYFRDFERLANWASSKPDMELAKALRMSIALIRNDVDEIRFWVESIPTAMEPTPQVRTTLCRYHLLRHQILQALNDQPSNMEHIYDALNYEMTHAEDEDNRYYQMQLRLLSAVAQSQNANTDLHEAEITQGLKIGQESDYFRGILDEDLLLQGNLMSLLQNTMKNIDKIESISPEYLKRLIHSGQPHSQDLAILHGEMELLESLTDREVEILRLFASGLSSRNIAEQLIISFHTVRTHLRNIYQKFDIHNRAQAIEKARDLNLI